MKIHLKNSKIIRQELQQLRKPNEIKRNQYAQTPYLNEKVLKHWLVAVWSWRCSSRLPSFSKPCIFRFRVRYNDLFVCLIFFVFVRSVKVLDEIHYISPCIIGIYMYWVEQSLAQGTSSEPFT